MGLELTYTHPLFPDGFKFTIDGVGMTPNGETVEVSEEDERAFIALHRRTVEDAFQGSENVEVSGSAAIASTEGIIPDEISDRVEGDPTVNNLTQEGEHYEFANLSGTPMVEEEEEVETVEEEAPPEGAEPGNEGSPPTDMPAPEDNVETPAPEGGGS